MSTTYLGFDVLDQTTPNMRDSLHEAFTRTGGLVGGAVGRRVWDDFAGFPFPQRSFSWFAGDRPGIQALRDFLAARRGRLTAFWSPTYAADLVMAADAHIADSSIVTRTIGYTRYLFPLIHRRYFALIQPAGTFLIRKASASVDNGNGTETVSFTSGLGVDLPAASTIVSFLELCRLDSDDAALDWSGADLVEATLAFRAVPWEVPA